MISIGPEAARTDVRRWHTWGFAGFLVTIALMLAAPAALDAFESANAIIGIVAVVGAVVAYELARRTALFRRRVSLLLWPVAACTAVTVLGVVTPDAAQLLLSVYALSCLYIGLSQPPGTALWLFPPALAGYWLVLGIPVEVAAIRLPVVALTWGLIAECPARLIAQLSAHQSVLTRLAVTDALTGLLNRSGLAKHLATCGDTDVIVLIDLDNFKNVNDEQGHLAGDQLLVDFARALTHRSRGSDAVYRYGGEEFLLVLESSSIDDARRVVDRMVEEWRRHPSGLTFSAGIVTGGHNALERADKVLYRAKQQGRGLILSGT